MSTGSTQLVGPEKETAAAAVPSVDAAAAEGEDLRLERLLRFPEAEDGGRLDEDLRKGS